MHRRVDISAIMAAYNADRFILESIQSVLAQTWPDFELIVVDDGSADRTAEIAASLEDPRIRLLRQPRNLGVVAARNAAAAVARGRYLAILDADDLAHPTRFAAQKAFLDAAPQVQMVGSEMSLLEKGRVTARRDPPSPDPVQLHWMLHHGNPIGHSSMMFRASALDSLGRYLREDMKYAEDFDFAHRIARLGEISVLPERLIIYRVHDQNLSRVRRAEMIARTAAVLAEAYAPLDIADAGVAAGIVARHLVAGDAPPSDEDLAVLGEALDAVLAGFLGTRATTNTQAAAIRRDAARAWWRAVLAAVSAGTISRRADLNAFSAARAEPPPVVRRLRATAARVLPAKALLQDLRRRALEHKAAAARSVTLRSGVRLTPAKVADDVPRLYVTIDAEAEFDWSAPFARDMTGVKAMAFQGPAQDIFARFGICPIYLVDHAVASQPEGYGPIRAFLGERRCVVGAHLHPWTTPPFDEPLSVRHSYGCNLPADLEYRKLAVLTAAVRGAFGVQPLFFKAGRYGAGANTAAALARLGFEVDFTIMPGADYRASGGPDFKPAGAAPYRYADAGLLAVPMTRGQVGPIGDYAPTLGRALPWTPWGRRLRGALARAGLLNTVTLTPEGVDAGEQKALIACMLRRGHRTFVLHYHSPSLMPGNTPYVRSQHDLARFLARLEEVTRFFIRDLGGLAGSPADLLAPQRRHLLWPSVQPEVEEPPVLAAVG